MTNIAPSKPLCADHRRVWNQIWMIMRLTIVLIIISTFTLSAKSYSQKVDLFLKNSPIETAFEQIRQQTGYSFFWKEQTLENLSSITVSLRKASLQEAVKACLKDLPLTFKIQGNIVYIERSEVTPLQADPNIKSRLFALPAITGKVTDAKGAPLAGVSVIVKGTNRGTGTDANGGFSIDANVGDVLEFTIVGYHKKTVNVEKQTEMNVILEVNVSDLSDVVVVGYGTQKKVNLTGSVSTLQIKDIVNVPYTNISQAITGRLPGVFSRQSGGTPGADRPDIRIRGASNALIVVDGVIGRDYNTIDPNDIESITVLKDAAAASVYGARASGGVILVTTKRGIRGENMLVSYSGSYGIQNPINLPAKLSLREQVYYHRLAASNMGLGDPYPTWTEDILKKFEDGSDYDHYAEVNWYDAVRKNVPITQHNLSLSGGQKNLTYFTSFGYEDQKGLYEVSNFSRYNARTNIDQYIPKINLHIGVDLDLRRNITLNPSGSNEQIWWFITQLNHEPFPAITTDGRYINTWGTNPFLETTYERGYRKNIEDRIATKLSVDWDVPHVDGLNFKVLASFDNVPSFYKSWSKWPRMYMSADDHVGYITAPLIQKIKCIL